MPSGWSSSASSRCSPSTSVWPKRSALVCASCSASCDFWVRRFGSMVTLLAVGQPPQGRLELRDPVEQIGDQADGRVVERETGAQPLDPGHRGQPGRREPQLARRVAGGVERRRGRRAGASVPGAGRSPRRTRPGEAGADADRRRSHCVRGHRLPPRVEVGRGRELLEQPPLAVGERAGTMILASANRSPACRAGWAGRGRAAAAAGRSRSRRDLHLGLAARGVDGDRRAERRLPRRERQVDVTCRGPHPVPRVRRDPHHEVQVSGGRAVAAPAALAGQPDPLAVGHAGRDVDVEGRAGAVTGQRDRPAAAAVGLLDGELELGLLVGAGNRAPAPAAPPPAAEEPAQQILDVDVARTAVARTRAAAARPGLPAAGSGPASGAGPAAPQVSGSTSSGTWRKSGPNAS